MFKWLLLLVAGYFFVKAVQSQTNIVTAPSSSSTGGTSANTLNNGTFFDRLRVLIVGGSASGGSGTGVTVTSPYTSTSLVGSAGGGSLSGTSTIHSNVRVGNGAF